jgi:hypothetical protein
VATPIHGRSGRLYVGIASDSASASPVANLKMWALSFKTDRVDVTCFGDTNKVKVAGLPDASGTFGGFYDTASAQLYTASSDGLARRFYLYPTTASTGTYWFGTAFFDFDLDGAVDGAVQVSGSFDAATSITKVG